MFIDMDLAFSRWNVSRETQDKISTFVATLYEWQKKINLISAPKGMKFDEFSRMVWQRHIIDSLQLKDHVSPDRDVMDIGSGGGFPGLILSLLCDNKFYLVESDKRKCQFLTEVSRQIMSRASIIKERVENLDVDQFQNPITMISRACASVSKLLELTLPFHSNANFLLLKGEKAKMELDEASRRWQISYQLYPSLTNERASIITIDGIHSYGKCKTD